MDYFAVLEAIQAALQAEPDLAGVRIEVEREVIFGAETTPWVGIYLERRDAPANLQRLRAGQQTGYTLAIVLWCWQYSLDQPNTAIRLRDDLVGNVEVALMKHRELGGLVAGLRLSGGEMPSMRVSAGFVSGGEIRVLADVDATTT